MKISSILLSKKVSGNKQPELKLLVQMKLLQSSFFDTSMDPLRRLHRCLHPERNKVWRHLGFNPLYQGSICPFNSCFCGIHRYLLQLKQKRDIIGHSQAIANYIDPVCKILCTQKIYRSKHSFFIFHKWSENNHWKIQCRKISFVLKGMENVSWVCLSVLKTWIT